MKETKRGLPNTCSNCGKNPGDSWYAEHEDAARSGQGLCKDCAFPKKEEKAVKEKNKEEKAE